MSDAATDVADSLIESIYDWLSDKPSTLWADWDISKHDGRLEAATWLANQMTDFASWGEADAIYVDRSH